MTSTRGYAEAAETLVAQYESISFETAHKPMRHLYPAAPCRVLDIGAGTGRDAAALARLGYDVTAVEPTAALRSAGQKLHATAKIRWIDDGLPQLDALRQSREKFDLILLTAVWMHLNATERAAGMATLASLAAPCGLVVMTLRHGPVPAGRRMYDVAGDETAALATQHGFRVEMSCRAEDSLGRADITWTCLALRAAGN